MASATVESLCQQARQAVAERDYNQARQLYLQALGFDPDDADVHYGLATVYFLLSDLESAVHHFKQVNRIDPHRAGAYINLGAVHHRLGRFDEALQFLRRGIQLDPHRAEGYYNLALVYRKQGQPALAAQAYQEALRINPRMADAHYNLANIYLEMGRYGPAITHYKQALEQRPGWDKAQNGLAQAQAAQMAAERGSAAPAETSRGAAMSLDPERTVDPNKHGPLLTVLHNATIDCDSHGRHFVEMLEKEIEPAIKELSACLLIPDSPLSELDECIKRFENAIHSIRSAQRSLQSSVEKIQNVGNQLLKS